MIELWPAILAKDRHTVFTVSNRTVKPFYYFQHLTGAWELFRVPKILRMPKRNQHPDGHTARAGSPATILQIPPDPEEESAATAMIAKWLTLADAVLGGDQTRKKA